MCKYLFKEEEFVVGDNKENQHPSPLPGVTPPLPDHLDLVRDEYPSYRGAWGGRAEGKTPEKERDDIARAKANSLKVARPLVCLINLLVFCVKVYSNSDNEVQCIWARRQWPSGYGVGLRIQASWVRFPAPATAEPIGVIGP